MDGKVAASSEEADESLSSGSKHGGWISFPFFIGMVAGLSLASAGIGGNLIVYLIQEFNIKSINAAQIVNVVVGSTSLFPLVAAILADSFFGSFSVAFVSSCVALLGTITLTLTATINSLKPHPCSNKSTTCKPPTGIQYIVLYISIVLISIGFGGSRYTAASLGANQFDKLEHQGSFFNWFFFTFYVASGVALTGVIYIEDNFGWSLGFGICVVATFVGVVVFLSGYRFYRAEKLQGSAVLDLGRVFVASVRKWKCKLSSKVEDYYVISSGCDDSMVEVLPPGKRLRFFNCAALITDADLKLDGSIKRSSWKLCTVQQVEDFNGTMQFIEAHRNANVRELNAQLTQINNTLDAEKKIGDELNNLHKETEVKFWWACPIDGMNKDQLELFKKALKELKKLVIQHAATQSLPFFVVNASSSNIYHHHQPNPQQAQMFPPQIFQNPMLQLQPHLFDGSMMPHHGFNNMV